MRFIAAKAYLMTGAARAGASVMVNPSHGLRMML